MTHLACRKNSLPSIRGVRARNFQSRTKVRVEYSCMNFRKWASKLLAILHLKYNKKPGGIS